jgi:hypothetical protein
LAVEVMLARARATDAFGGEELRRLRARLGCVWLPAATANARVGVGVSTVDVVDMCNPFGEAMAGSPRTAGGLTVRPAPLPSLLAGRGRVWEWEWESVPGWRHMG